MNGFAGNRFTTSVSILRRRLLAMVAGLGLMAGAFAAVAAQDQPDPNGTPDAFVQQVAENALQVLKTDPTLKQGDVRRINELIDQHLLPYVDFEKTTRLAAATYWRQATPEQREALVREFRAMLVRVYSGAFSKVDPNTQIVMLPFRGNADAKDVVVRTQVKYSGSQPVAVDYRLERTSGGWKVYDVSVEGLWLIQRYRDQFATLGQQGGVDAIIKRMAELNQ